MNPETLLPAFRYIDNSFKKEFSSGYHLSFIIGKSGLAYCVIDLIQNCLVGLEEACFEKLPDYEQLCGKVKNFISGSPILNGEFKSVSVGIYHETATLIPAALFDERKKDEILRFNFSGEIISTANDFLQNLDLHNVYDGPEIIGKTFKSIYSKAKVFHFSSSLLESLCIENKNKSGTKAYLHFFQKNRYGSASRFEVIIFRNGNLIFFNSFFFREKEDIIYYLLLVMGQLNIYPEKTIVTMIGNIPGKDEAVRLVDSYVHSVDFGNRPGNLTCPPGFEEMPPHFYYALISQYLYI